MQAGLAWLAEIPKRTITQREVVSFFGFFQTAQAGNWPEALRPQPTAREAAATARAGWIKPAGWSGVPAAMPPAVEGIL